MWLVFVPLQLALLVGCADDDAPVQDAAAGADAVAAADGGGVTDGIGAGGDGAISSDAASGARFANMFAAKACNAAPGTHLRDTYCGGAAGGTPADFDKAAFERLYRDLADTTLYPSSGTGAYKRQTVPMCEDGTDDLRPDGKCKSDGKEPIRCTDGTRPVASVRLPDSASKHAKDWMLRVQGGGDACADHPLAINCYAQGGLDFTSATVKAARAGKGLFASTAPAGAPPFHRWGSVYMDKCTGDRNTGAGRVDDYDFRRSGTHNGKEVLRNRLLRTQQSLAAGRGPVYFHGRRMVIAIIARLAKSKQLVGGSRLLLVTQSNGSHGLYQYIDDVAQRADALVGADVDVRAAPSSMLRNALQVENYLRTKKWGDLGTGATVSAPASTAANLVAYNKTTQYRADYLFSQTELDNPMHGAKLDDTVFKPGGVEHGRMSDWGAAPDASCLAAAGANGCADAMNVLLGHISTPLFITAQTADFAVRTFANDYAVAPGGRSEPGSVRLGVHPDDFEDRVRAMVARLDGLDRGFGAFVVNTDDHMGLTNDTKLARTVGGVRLVQALYDWVMAKPGTESFCLSRRRSGTQSWYHVIKDGVDGYVDGGADPALACPGAKP